MPRQKPTNPAVIAELQRTAVKARLWAKMQPLSNGCVRWLGALSANGYGVFSLANPKVTLSAHKAMFIATHGRDVTTGMELSHRCDNEWCVAENHIEEKTHRENLQDRYLRNRYPSRYKTRFLSDEQIREIRKKWKPRFYSQEKLAKEYGVSRSVIQGVIERTKYKDVKD